MLDIALHEDSATRSTFQWIEAIADLIRPRLALRIAAIQLR